MRYDEAAGIVVISPHLDDAVLSTWCVLRAGNASVVDVCTAAPPAGALTNTDRMFGVDDSSRLVEMRHAEETDALALAGCTAVSLGFLDNQYRDAPVPPAELRDAFDDVIPAASALCVPAGIGRHPDHVASREAALALARIRSVPVRLYADMPYAVRFGWPDWVTGLPPRPHLVPEACWQEDLLETAASVDWDDLVPHGYRLDAAEVARKVRALECYRTQFAALNAGPLDRVRHPEVIGFELHWDVSRWA